MASSLAPSRTPPGVRELKLIKDEITKKPIPSRTPPGVRELKQCLEHDTLYLLRSHPSRGA